MEVSWLRSELVSRAWEFSGGGMGRVDVSRRHTEMTETLHAFPRLTSHWSLSGDNIHSFPQNWTLEALTERLCAFSTSLGHKAF